MANVSTAFNVVNPKSAVAKVGPSDPAPRVPAARARGFVVFPSMFDSCHSDLSLEMLR